MSSTELFRKHFGEESAAIDLKHPNMEAFFNDLNEECLRENENGKNPYLLTIALKSNENENENSICK